MFEEDLFDELPDDLAQLDDWRAGKQIRCEERMVRTVLTRMGNLEMAAELRELRRQRTGAGVLTFDWFNTECPAFPVRLSARDLFGLHNLSVRDLFLGFKKSVAWKAFEDARDEARAAEDGRPVGVCFSWPALGNVILHDSRYAAQDQFRASWTYGRNHQWAYLDRLHPWLDALVETLR